MRLRPYIIKLKTLKFITVLSLIAALMSFSFLDKPTEELFVVVLDAGHGGKDPGKKAGSILEKEIALNVVLKVGKKLEAIEGVKVIYTRKTDVFIPLRERAKIANKADADLFVSIHCNSHTSQAYGSETFVLGLHENSRNFNVAKSENEVIFLEDDYEMHYEGFDPNAPESIIGLTLMQEEYLDQSTLLASYVQDQFTNTLKRKNRGVKQAGFWVLHNTYMPSILIEMGFISNTREGRYLNSKKGQNQMAQSIANAILKYKTRLDQNVGELVYETDDDINTEQTSADSSIIFKVQIAASSRKLDLKPYNFKGLKNITRKQEGKLYKYYYGATPDYNTALLQQKLTTEKGYKTSFIVAYKNNTQIPLEEALKSKIK